MVVVPSSFLKFSLDPNFALIRQEHELNVPNEDASSLEAPRDLQPTHVFYNRSQCNALDRPMEDLSLQLAMLHFHLEGNLCVLRNVFQRTKSKQ